MAEAALEESPVAISLEIEGCSWTAANPREVCRGECAGPVQYIPNRAGSEAWQAELRRVADRNKKAIFICDSASMALRPLLPHALGFVFGEGATLGHFCRALRHHQVPAVIDAYLWQQARAAGTGTSARLRCGQAVPLSSGVLAHHQAQVQEYRRRLYNQRAAIPVYDVASGEVRAGEALVDPRIGEKALGVNALQAEGFPAAKALILTHPARAWLKESPAFLSILKRTFPLFGSAPGYALIVRGSLHSNEGSHPGMPGLLTSPSVTSLDGLVRAVDEHVSRWESIRLQDRLELSIILQERIASPVFGILGTACPWDYNQAGSVAELTLDHGKGTPQAQIFLNNVETILQEGSLAESIKPFAASNSTIAREGFCDTFARLVQDGLALRDRYSLPLDIEFVVTGELWHVFVQFRPLYRLDPPSHEET